MRKDRSKLLDLPPPGQGVSALKIRRMTRAGLQPVRSSDRWLLRKLLTALGDPPFSFELWNGEEVAPCGTGPRARIKLRNRRVLYRMLTHSSLNFGDDYSTGGLEVEGDLVHFLESAYRAVEKSQAKAPLLASLLWRDTLPRGATMAGARANIHHHYDLGNGFYQLWLDHEAMQYTCAYFPYAGMSLEDAQQAKMHHICRKLWLKRGEAVVEAGCGWGGLALFMAKHYGVSVKAYNLSREQVAYARRRVADEGLSSRVEYVEEDYRNIRGDYDVFVSIGMLEHVGRAHYRELGSVIDRCLKDTGRGLVHGIGRNRPRSINAWIEKRIFPGAYPPTLREMMGIFEPFSFSILDVENLRLHYAQTLAHWLMRYEAQVDRIRRDHDESFVRAWRLYMAGSLASFTTGWLQLFQVVFSRHNNNDLPPSRAHIYELPRAQR